MVEALAVVVFCYRTEFVDPDLVACGLSQPQVEAVLHACDEHRTLPSVAVAP